LDKKLLGERIRSCRKREGITQEILAERTGVSTIHICYIENGQRKISLELLEKIAVELSTSVGRLLYPRQSAKVALMMDEIEALVSDCSLEELRITRDVILALKLSLRRSADC
jgi:transcriptional regulator with XRE-family HTH domain